MRLLETINLPDYALCPLFNADSSGISEEDEQIITAWEESYGDLLPITINIIDEEPSFCSSPEFGLPCNCYTAEIYTNK